MIKRTFLLLFVLSGFGPFAQNKDSLEKYEKDLAVVKDEVQKIKILNSLAEFTRVNYFDRSIKYSMEALELCEKLNNVKGKVNAFNNIGDAYWYHGNINKAEKYYFDAYRLNDSIHDELGLARSMYNMGWILCITQEQKDKAYYLFNSLRIYEKLNNLTGKVDLYDAVANYYSTRYESDSNKVFYDSSVYYYKKAIETGKGNEMAILDTYTNFGSLLLLANDLVNAKSYFEKGLELSLRSGDSSNIFYNKCQLAFIEIKSNNADKALTLLKEVMGYGLRSGTRMVLRMSYDGLHLAYKSKKDYKRAYEYLMKYKEEDNNSYEQSVKSKLLSYQNIYETEKKEADIKALKQANEIQELKNKQSNFIMAGAIGVAVVVLFIAYLLYKQNREKQSVNLLLTQQNQLITNKSQEIRNSIEYAKGIQNALLPDPNDIHKNLKDSFIYYSPKDVVSGDFYWFHEAGNYFYCIAADCTGHGVPGALMSIVSMDKLYQAVFEKKITEPSGILSFLNTEIKNALKQHHNEAKQKDGLDLALLRFNKDLTSVTYCGANRPLYHIRDGILNEHKANKVAIAGFTPNDHQFKQEEISLKKNDTLYIFSDGYADQFGGPEGKKFMTRNFKSMVTTLSGKDISEQKREVIRTFEGWKGNYEQVDDILVIGIKI